MTSTGEMALWLLGDALFVSVLCMVLYRKGHLKADDEVEEVCDFCGSNCGQCGSSYRKTGDGSEVFNAAVKKVGGKS